MLTNVFDYMSTMETRENFNSYKIGIYVHKTKYIGKYLFDLILS